MHVNYLPTFEAPAAFCLSACCCVLILNLGETWISPFKGSVYRPINYNLFSIPHTQMRSFWCRKWTRSQLTKGPNLNFLSRTQNIFCWNASFLIPAAEMWNLSQIITERCIISRFIFLLEAWKWKTDAGVTSRPFLRRSIRKFHYLRTQISSSSSYNESCILTKRVRFIAHVDWWMVCRFFFATRGSSARSHELITS